MTNKICFEETKPRVFESNKSFHIKNKNFWVDESFKEIDDFCYKLRNGITNIIENVNKKSAEKLFKNEFSELQNII